MNRHGKRRLQRARFVEGEDRSQVALLPECLDDFVAEDNPVRVVDAFVSELDLQALGFDGLTPASTGRHSYHPAVLLKIYIYGYSIAFSPAAAWSASASGISS
jgi:transposase